MELRDFTESFFDMYAFCQYGIIRPLNQYCKKMNLEIAPDDYCLIKDIKNRDGMTMTAIAQSIFTTKQQATIKIDKLVNKGYLARLSDESDRRIIKVVTTKKAESALEGFNKSMGSFMDTLSEQMTENGFKNFGNEVKSFAALLPELRLES